MARMMLLYNNHADSDGVAFSGGSWALPLTNLQDPRPSKKARSSTASTVDSMFRVDLGSVMSFRALALTHTNLTAGALYRVTWYSDDYLTPIGNSGWLAVPGYPADDPDDIGASIFHVFAASTAARYWQFEINDGGNGAGFVEIGRLCMMDTWVPAYNFGTDNSEGAVPNTPRQNSLGGVGYFNRRKPARFFNFAFSTLPDAEIPTLRRIRKICNLDRQIIVIPDPDDTANLNDTCFLATLKELPSLALLLMGDASIGFQATEVIG
ncbi:MAG: hypothetical protein J0H71_05560 [Rhizobiales bacterium]|nr:hypothetical protein [Hyphomicrobiales bacterium]